MIKLQSSSFMKELTAQEDFELPSWVVPLDILEKQLGALGIDRKELLRDYEHFLKKLSEAFSELNQKAISEAKSGVLDQSLGDSDLTLGWLMENLKKVSEHVKDVLKITCEVLSTDGFVSQIIRIKMTTIYSNVNLIVKLPETRSIRSALLKTVGSELADNFLPLSDMDNFARGLVKQFNREVEFYNRNTLTQLKLPRIHFSQKWEFNMYTGAIVMEDLSHLKAVPLFESLNCNQLDALFEQVNILHVNSFEMDNMWGEQFPYPQCAMDILTKMMDVVDVFVTKNPELAYLFSILRPFYFDTERIEFLMKDYHKTIGMPDVICHGDLWTYNFLWEQNENGQPSSRLGSLIDWQNVHIGSIGEDFGHLLVFCCDPELRKYVEAVRLPKYFEELRRTVVERGNQFNISLAQFEKAYRSTFLVHALHLPFISNVMLSIKTAPSEEIQDMRNMRLVARTKAAWEDAVQILREDFPHWLESNSQNGYH